MLASGFNPSMDVVLTLLKNGAQINQKDKKGWNSLIYACATGENPDIIITLLQRGANANIRDAMGKSAIDYAKNNPKIYNTKAYEYLQTVSTE